jgi:hypothetical protein
MNILKLIIVISKIIVGSGPILCLMNIITRLMILKNYSLL